MVLEVVQFILGLGPTVMLPIVITIIGMCFGQGFKKAFQSGITIGRHQSGHWSSDVQPW